jgi:hypothetical protein
MRIAMLALLFASTAGAASAQTVFGEIELLPRGDALSRYYETDAMPHCAWHSGGWVCRSTAEERAAHALATARLRNEVTALKKQLVAAGEVPAPAPAFVPPSGAVPPALAPVAPPRTTEIIAKPPRRGVLLRASDCLEATWRRVVDMIVGALG